MQLNTQRPTTAPVEERPRRECTLGVPPLDSRSDGDSAPITLTTPMTLTARDGEDEAQRAIAKRAESLAKTKGGADLSEDEATHPSSEFATPDMQPEKKKKKVLAKKCTIVLRQQQ